MTYKRFMLKSSTFKASHNFFYIYCLAASCYNIVTFLLQGTLLWQTEKLYSSRVERYIFLLEVLKILLQIYNNKKILYTAFMYNNWMCFVGTLCFTIIIYFAENKNEYEKAKHTLICNNKEIMAQYSKCTSGKRIKEG